MAVGVRARPVVAPHTDSNNNAIARPNGHLAVYSRYLGHLLLIGLLVLVVRNVSVTQPQAPSIDLPLANDAAVAEGLPIVGPEPATHYLEQGAVPLTVRLLGEDINPIAAPSRQARTTVITYKVQPGDSVLGIAQRFGLEGSTLLWSNAKLENNPDFLQVGQELNILPVNGAYHTVARNDTVESLAKFYKVDVAAITGYAGNDLSAPYALTVGQQLIIPGGTKPYVPRQVVTSATAPAPQDAKSGSGSFAWPMSGSISQRFWEGHRAIDIANSRGTAVYSADSGYVSATQWASTGYGRMVIVDHGNGYSTLYAHLDSIAVEVGENVSKGQQLGKCGSTGNSSGPHLHFEVIQGSARLNPFNYLP